MEMSVSINQLDQNNHFEARGAQGSTVAIDGSEAHKGMRPMELLLTAVGSCAAFDVVHILKKQKIEPEGLKVDVSGSRVEEGDAKPFKAIHIVFTLKGTIDEGKAQRAVKLAVEKYCSVAETLDRAVKISFDLKLEA